MPQLPASVQSTVKAAVNPFGLMDVHITRAALRKVEVGEGAKGPYWKWEYQIVEGEAYAKRYIRNITSLSEAAAFNLQETFDAFGVDASVDTDELIGQTVRLKIGQRTNNRTGELENTVRGVLKDADTDNGTGSDLPF